MAQMVLRHFPHALPVFQLLEATVAQPILDGTRLGIRRPDSSVPVQLQAALMALRIEN
jgi:hypothetical protein